MLPGKRAEISTTIPVTAGIIPDLNRLYRNFRQKYSLRLRDFCEIFREMGLSEIWKGRQSTAELIEFSEKLLQTCATYMNIYRQSEAGVGELILHTEEERVFGIYCCYAFYFLQPNDYVTTIRVTGDDLQEIGEFVRTTLLPGRHYDGAACLYKLIDSGAFRIVPFRSCYDPFFNKRYDAPEFDEIVTEFPEEPFSDATKIVNDPLLKQIGMLQEKYDRMKTVHMPNVRVARNISDVLSELLSMGKDALGADLAGGNPATSLQEESGTDKSSKLTAKEKAYKSGISYNRNRRYADPNMQGIDDLLADGGETKGKNMTFGSISDDILEEGRARKRKRTTSANKGQEEVPSLSVQENRKKSAAKKKQQQEEAKALAAGLLPPLEQEETAADKLDTPLKLFKDPLSKSTRPKPPIETTDPEFAKVLKNYEATAEERKIMAEMERLTGKQPTAPSPTKAKTPARRKTATKKKQDE